MFKEAKIALQLSYAHDANRYFSFRLKQQLTAEPAYYNQPGKLLAVSDIEGDFDAFAGVLLRHRIINKYFQWIFEDGHLVIAGDCFDGGERVAELLWLIYSLEEQARKDGGYVHFILGNHEIMNLNGDWRYVHPRYASSSKIPYTALYSGNTELWRWLCTKNIMEKIGDTLFVHGGIAPELLQFGLSIDQINKLARPYYARAHEQFTDPVLTAIFNTDNSPFLYRDYYQPTEVTEEQVNKVLEHFGVRTIVTGHTALNKITAFFNGKVINIDTNESGNLEALMLKRGHFYRIDVHGKRERIK